MILIRSARINEVRKLQHLYDEVFARNSIYDPDVRNGWAQSEMGERYFAAAIDDPGGCFLVAEDNKKLVGFIAASSKSFDDRNSRYVEIDNLGVVPDYLRRGVGKKLIDACLTWARNEGFQKAHLRCYSANAAALAFYRRNGFRDISMSLEKIL